MTVTIKHIAGDCLMFVIKTLPNFVFFQMLMFEIESSQYCVI